MQTDELFESTSKEDTPKDDQEIINVLEQSIYTVSALRKILDFTQRKQNEDDTSTNKTDKTHHNDSQKLEY
jgi:hypothetical protein